MLASAMAGYTGKRRLAVATPIGHRKPELVTEKATCPTCGGPAELGLPYTSSTPDETVVHSHWCGEWKPITTSQEIPVNAVDPEELC